MSDGKGRGRGRGKNWKPQARENPPQRPGTRQQEAAQQPTQTEGTEPPQQASGISWSQELGQSWGSEVAPGWSREMAQGWPRERPPSWGGGVTPEWREGMVANWGGGTDQRWVEAIPTGTVGVIPAVGVGIVPHGGVGVVPTGGIGVVPSGGVGVVSPSGFGVIPAGNVGVVPPGSVGVLPAGSVGVVPTGRAVVSPGWVEVMPPGWGGGWDPGWVGVMPPGRVEAIPQGSAEVMPPGWASVMPPGCIPPDSGGGLDPGTGVGMAQGWVEVKGPYYCTEVGTSYASEMDPAHTSEMDTTYTSEMDTAYPSEMGPAYTSEMTQSWGPSLGQDPSWTSRTHLGTHWGSQIGPEQSWGSQIGPEQSWGSQTGPEQSWGSQTGPEQSWGSQTRPGLSWASGADPGSSRSSGTDLNSSWGPRTGLGRSWRAGTIPGPRWASGTGSSSETRIGESGGLVGLTSDKIIGSSRNPRSAPMGAEHVGQSVDPRQSQGEGSHGARYGSGRARGRGLQQEEGKVEVGGESGVKRRPSWGEPKDGDQSWSGRKRHSVCEEEDESSSSWQGKPKSKSKRKSKGRRRNDSRSDQGSDQGSDRRVDEGDQGRGQRRSDEGVESIRETTDDGRGDEAGEGQYRGAEGGEGQPGEKGEDGSGGKGDGGGDGKDSKTGRARKGRVPLVPPLETKPKTCVSKQGTSGVPVNLLTNYFEVETIPNWVLYQYRVDFDSEEDREHIKRAWLNQHKQGALSVVFIFDGNHIYTFQRLTKKTPDALKLVSTRLEDAKEVTIDIKFVQEMIRGHGAYLQVFNVLLRRCLIHLQLHLVQRNYFDPKVKIPLPQHNLEVWPGYLASIRQYDGGILMCTELAHKVMRTDTAYKVLKDCSSQPDYRRAFQQCMIGATVLTDYTNKTYQISDVDYNSSPLSTFLCRDKEVTFVDYYKERYQLTVNDMNQPLLITRVKLKGPRQPGHEAAAGPALLVPELARMTGLSRMMLSNRLLMKDLSKITRVGPLDRVNRLEAFNRRLQAEPKVVGDFRDWGLKISSSLKRVRGRHLPGELVVGGNGRTYGTGPFGDWTTPQRSTPVFLNGKISSWVFIIPQRIRQEVQNFLVNMKKAAEGMSMHLPSPIIYTTHGDSGNELVDAVDICLAKHSPDLIAFGFMNDQPDRYIALKRKCCVERGVASQVILRKSMTSGNALTIATKVAVQICCKTGGVPWHIHIPTESCMVVGFDVCHERSMGNKSVGAMVASINPQMTRWYSSVNQHTAGLEISQYLPNDVCKAVRRYYDLNNRMPGRIFVYRDGVGEGQLHHVYQTEVSVLKKKLTELYGGEHWKLAYIIVTKRIHTRIFQVEREKVDNPRPGTVVDETITLPERYDFYLVSQSVRQGTVSPTNYNIIADNIGWGPDYIQRFTYKMTHLYYNCSATVQVPAPCQYAHKLAFLTTVCLNSDPHPNLVERLYFL